MHIGVVGTGAVGARVFRHLRSREGVTASEMPGGNRRHLLPQLRKKTSADVVVLARPHQVSSAAFYLSRGVSVVSVAGGLGEVENLLALNSLAIGNDATLVAGAAFSPGVSCLLVAKAASEFQLVEEIHVARAGTGGRACAPPCPLRTRRPPESRRPAPVGWRRPSAFRTTAPSTWCAALGNTCSTRPGGGTWTSSTT